MSHSLIIKHSAVLNICGSNKWLNETTDVVMNIKHISPHFSYKLFYV